MTAVLDKKIRPQLFSITQKQNYINDTEEKAAISDWPKAITCIKRFVCMRTGWISIIVADKTLSWKKTMKLFIIIQNEYAADIDQFSLSSAEFGQAELHSL